MAEQAGTKHSLRTGLPSDTSGRKVAHQMGHDILAHLQKNKRAGDHFVFTAGRSIAVGEEVRLTIAPAAKDLPGEFWSIDLVEGVEP